MILFGIVLLIAGVLLAILATRTLEATAATLLAAFILVAGFSFGLFYLPSAAAMLVAAAFGRQIRASA